MAFSTPPSASKNLGLLQPVQVAVLNLLVARIFPTLLQFVMPMSAAPAPL